MVCCTEISSTVLGSAQFTSANYGTPSPMLWRWGNVRSSVVHRGELHGASNTEISVQHFSPPTTGNFWQHQHVQYCKMLGVNLTLRSLIRLGHVPISQRYIVIRTAEDFQKYLPYRLLMLNAFLLNIWCRVCNAKVGNCFAPCWMSPPLQICIAEWEPMSIITCNTYQKSHFQRL